MHQVGVHTTATRHWNPLLMLWLTTRSFVIAEVAVRQAVHEAVTERIQLLRGPTLSDTRAARIVCKAE